MEKRIIRVMMHLSGGNSGANTLNYRISLPSKWMHDLNITKEDRELELTYDEKEKTILIKRK